MHETEDCLRLGSIPTQIFGKLELPQRRENCWGKLSMINDQLCVGIRHKSGKNTTVWAILCTSFQGCESPHSFTCLLVFLWAHWKFALFWIDKELQPSAVIPLVCTLSTCTEIPTDFTSSHYETMEFAWTFSHPLCKPLKQVDTLAKKKILLRERKRHTTCRVASPRGGRYLPWGIPSSWPDQEYPPWPGGTYLGWGSTYLGVPPHPR